MRPLFSIITVTYNAESTIGRTLDSVDSQSCTLYEHLIIDGESTDGTSDIVKAHPNPNRHLISGRDNGIYDAMNKGISAAQGHYLIFLNSGDTLHSPATLQRYADKIMDNDYPGIVYGQTRLVDINGNYIGERHLRAPEKLTPDSFKDGMSVCHQAMAVYSKLVAPYNLRYKYSADYEWAIVCLRRSKRNVYIPDVTIDYLSEGATTKHHKESLLERFKIMCIYFGTWPTILRHLKFAIRYLSRRSKAGNIQ